MADNDGKKCSVHYRGTLDDGTQFDSSYDRGQTLDFTCGAGQMIKGFDAAVRTMELGEKRIVRLEPADAYGERREDMVIDFPASIAEVTAEKVVVDANHELAGKSLTFEIELVSVE